MSNFTLYLKKYVFFLLFVHVSARNIGSPYILDSHLSMFSCTTAGCTPIMFRTWAVQTFFCDLNQEDPNSSSAAGNSGNVLRCQDFESKALHHLDLTQAAKNTKNAWHSKHVSKEYTGAFLIILNMFCFE